jgi:NAD(P)-dependent dehydrogenase (short-subunit alcohol dehydrogenase family)
MKFAQNAFLVTGGGSGLGGATARALIRRGANVMIADVNDEAASALAADLGAQARFIHTDVTSEADGTQAVKAAIEQFGALHGLINCAGIGIAAKVVGRDGPHALSRFAQVINVNLIGTFNMIRLAAAAMAKAEPNIQGERGVIINTASIAAYDGQIGQAAYAASKSGVVGLTLPIARELAGSGIRVVTIAPGIFATPMMAGLPEAAQLSLGASVPFPARLGQPDEFASLVCHICENVMLNGETIRLDGALRMAPR